MAFVEDVKCRYDSTSKFWTVLSAWRVVFKLTNMLLISTLLNFLSVPFFGLSIISAQVTQYLLDKTLIMDEDTLYDLSLKIEPRLPAWDPAACGPVEACWTWTAPRTPLKPLEGNRPMWSHQSREELWERKWEWKRRLKAGRWRRLRVLPETDWSTRQSLNVLDWLSSSERRGGGFGCAALVV